MTARRQMPQKYVLRRVRTAREERRAAARAAASRRQPAAEAEIKEAHMRRVEDGFCVLHNRVD